MVPEILEVTENLQAVLDSGCRSCLFLFSVELFYGHSVVLGVMFEPGVFVWGGFFVVESRAACLVEPSRATKVRVFAAAAFTGS
tara:strand:+ start:1363 stop:1614 length:252 start_codon:yes stop_codon:yes gene_type:complete